MDIREDELSASSQAAHPSGYRVNRLGLQIIRNTIPNYDRLLGRIKSLLYQTIRRHLVIEVNRHKAYMRKVGA